MRYHANISENIINAAQANDKALTREIVLDEIVTLIEESPEKLAEALRQSNVKVRAQLTKEELIDRSAYALINNPIFQKNIAVVLAAQEENRTPAREEFASSDGEDGGGMGIVASISNAVNSAFTFGTATQNLKSEEVKAKAMMYSKIFGKEKKRNWLPIVAITGVLLIGALVVWRVTATKK
jgi:hypothetical protein